MNKIFNFVSSKLKNQKLTIINSDLNRNWGGFFRLADNESDNFIKLYFNRLNKYNLFSLGKVSSKILIISPNKRLSWQYHIRRTEIWKVVSGKIKVVTSHDDLERKEEILKEGDEIRLSKCERHRIIGLDDYAVVAEIWIHTDKDNPSDENDIVRLQDDFDIN